MITVRFKIPPCPECGAPLSVRCLDNTWYATCMACAYSEFDHRLEDLLSDIREYACDSEIHDGDYVPRDGETIFNIPLQ